MATNLAIDTDLLDEALLISGLNTKKDYDYKKGRSSK